MKNFALSSLFTAAVLCLWTAAPAQNKATVNIKGHVVAYPENQKEGKEAVPFAVVLLPDLNVAATTDSEGAFELKKLAPDTYKVQVSSLGYETLDTTILVSAAKTEYDFVLRQSNFRMEEVVVTARTSKAGASTASVISKAAMEHMQATSLSDIMSLMPGGSTTRPDLQGVSTASVRGGSSLGTAVIMDGSPLSNNANMQMLSGAMGAKSPISNGNNEVTLSPSSGVDLRTITTDNIESIEVIRGVAPVEYGDITSGAIIVNSKAGRQPLTVKLNINPNVYSVSATQGFALGKKAGNINYGADYAYSMSDPREGYDFYQRVTGRVGYTNTFGRLYTNTSLSMLWTKDKGEPNPDDPQDKKTSNQRDWGLRFNANGTYNVNNGWFKNIQYNVSFGYTNRKSFFEDEATNADVPYSYSKTDGTVLSSYPGGHIYDDQGNEITNFGTSPNGIFRAWMLPATYTYNYNLYGKELNTFAKVKANFAGKLGATHHRMVVGVDFKSDGNLGRGKVFDLDNPPYRNVSYTFGTQRERAFKDIPFVNQFGAFFEENFRATILGRELNIAAGVRYDHTLDFGGGFSPRVNVAYEILPKKLSVHAAYGITRKAPTLAYLYPDDAYFDILNFNNASSSKVPDAQKMQLVTTRVFDAKNYDLKMARQDKYEIGLNAHIGKMSFSVVAYYDEMLNGYTFGKTPDTFKSVDLIEYNATYPTDGTSAPILTQKASNKYLLEYTTATNNSAYTRQGVEFDFNFGRIDAIRTSFILNGNIYTHKSWNRGYLFYNRVKTNDYSQYPDMGVFNSKDAYGVGYTENFITNLIVTHNIPKIGFVITATANVNWRHKSWDTYGEDDIVPIAYISRLDGKMYDFDKSWADPSSARYEEFRYLLRDEAVDPLRRLHEKAYSPILCMNLNITKQFGDMFDVSFFANNMFRSTPVHTSSINPSKHTRRNSSLFFFGLQINARIK